MKAVRDFLNLIKFEHTIFALPFAYLGMLLAAGGLPTFWQFFWITIAMAAARTVAMGFNRIADRWHDAHNPRTASRHWSQGRSRSVLPGSVLLLPPWFSACLPGCWDPCLFYCYPERCFSSSDTHLPSASPGCRTSFWVHGWTCAGWRLGSYPRLSLHSRRFTCLDIAGRSYIMDRRFRLDLCLPGYRI